jgi:hypothetical protein
VKESIRCPVAYIAARLISGLSADVLYDYARSVAFAFNGTANTDGVSVFDSTAKCHIGGRCNHGIYFLFHFGEGVHINLEIDGGKFKGFDYQSHSDFSGTVAGKRISLYDWGESKWFNYPL